MNCRQPGNLPRGVVNHIRHPRHTTNTPCPETPNRVDAPSTRLGVPGRRAATASEPPYPRRQLTKDYRFLAISPFIYNGVLKGCQAELILAGEVELATVLEAEEIEGRSRDPPAWR